MMAAARRPTEPGDNGDMERRRRGRNIALGLVLGVLVVLFYAITLIKMGGSQ